MGDAGIQSVLLEHIQDEVTYSLARTSWLY